MSMYLFPQIRIKRKYENRQLIPNLLRSEHMILLVGLCKMEKSQAEGLQAF